MTNPLVNNNQEEVIVMAAPEKKEFAIGSEKFTLSELVTHLDLDGQSDQEKNNVIAMHVRKGSVQPLNKQTKQEKILQNVTKGLAAITHIQKLHVEQAQSVHATRAKKNDDRLKYDDIKFSVTERVVAEDVSVWLASKGIPIVSFTQDMTTFEYIFALGEVTDAELNSLDKYLKGRELRVKMKSAGSITLGVTSSLTRGTIAATGAVIAGTTKLAVDITGKAVEATTAIGASAIVRTKDIAQESVRNLSNNREAVEAKEMLVSGWDALKRKIGGGNKTRFF